MNTEREDRGLCVAYEREGPDSLLLLTLKGATEKEVGDSCSHITFIKYLLFAPLRILIR